MTSPQTPTPKQKTPEEQAAEKVFNIGCGGFILFILVIWIFSAVQTAYETPEQKAAKQAQVLNEWFESGSDISCENNLKEQLRDPNSYERDGDFTTPSNDGKKRIITWKFRAKNGFGGYTPGIGMCLITKENGGTIKATTLGQ
jgi:Na+-translocating ferredoxin:NAD+ oxidoreductase RnfG subunit